MSGTARVFVDVDGAVYVHMDDVVADLRRKAQIARDAPRRTGDDLPGILVRVFTHEADQWAKHAMGLRAEHAVAVARGE